MTTAQSKRLTTLEGTIKGPMEPIQTILHIVRPDKSTAGYMTRDENGRYIDMDPSDPRLEGYPPITPEINGGYRMSDWIEMGHTPYDGT